MYPYDPDWAIDFEPERIRLAPILQPFLVQPLEHMGSTSIPGLVAKPIIDMLAVVEDIALVVAMEGPLREIGWVLALEPADEVERRLSFCTPSRDCERITFMSLRNRLRACVVGSHSGTTFAKIRMSPWSTAS
jgi:GrpB-like predicted nucleotidyltransferase (UPF0157 family)